MLPYHDRQSDNQESNWVTKWVVVCTYWICQTMMWLLFQAGHGASKWFHHTVHSDVQLKTYELFISRTFSLIFSDCICPLVTETVGVEGLCVNSLKNVLVKTVVLDLLTRLKFHPTSSLNKWVFLYFNLIWNWL